MDSNNSVYVRMMVDVLKRKEKILQRILKQTVIMEIRCIPAWTGWSLKTGLRR